MAELLAQLAKLFPLVGGESFYAFYVVSISFLYPVSNGLLGRFRLLDESRGLPPVSREFNDPVSEFIEV